MGARNGSSFAERLRKSLQLARLSLNSSEFKQSDSGLALEPEINTPIKNEKPPIYKSKKGWGSLVAEAAARIFKNQGLKNPPFLMQKMTKNGRDCQVLFRSKSKKPIIIDESMVVIEDKKPVKMAKSIQRSSRKQLEGTNRQKNEVIITTESGRKSVQTPS